VTPAKGYKGASEVYVTSVCEEAGWISVARVLSSHRVSCLADMSCKVDVHLKYRSIHHSVFVSLSVFLSTLCSPFSSRTVLSFWLDKYTTSLQARIPVLSNLFSAFGPGETAAITECVLRRMICSSPAIYKACITTTCKHLSPVYGIDKVDILPGTHPHMQRS
jgi:hypothetical protein